MTALLSHELSENFNIAHVKENFFDRDEKRNIDNLEVREQPKPGMPKDSCNANLFFGFFFDGTKNNYVQAGAGKNHSNVARLYDCYPGLSVPGVLPKTTDWQHNPSRYTHFYKVYVPGVSSPFQQVNDTGTGMGPLRSLPSYL